MVQVQVDMIHVSHASILRLFKRCGRIAAAPPKR
jgi:hypothetical protein